MGEKMHIRQATEQTAYRLAHVWVGMDGEDEIRLGPLPGQRGDGATDLSDALAEALPAMRRDQHQSRVPVDLRQAARLLPARDLCRGPPDCVDCGVSRDNDGVAINPLGQEVGAGALGRGKGEICQSGRS